MKGKEFSMSDKIRIVNQASIPFRYDDKSGPKYVTRGPNVDFGLVKILPGEDFSTHHHVEVEEIFYTLEGECEIYIDGEKAVLRPGDLIQVTPKSNHYLRNTGAVAWTAVFVKSPYNPKDKVDVDWMPGK
jgi:mannose-6-phosphate isomerase-like protein (cupin superfamily)